MQFTSLPNESFMLSGVAEHFDSYKGKLDIVVDIGAHVGELSILAAQRGAKYIWAIEPDKDNCALLYKNIEANGYEDIIKVVRFTFTQITQDCPYYPCYPTYPVAIAKENGWACLRKAGDNTGQRSLLYSPNVYTSTQRVYGITLSRFFMGVIGEEIDYLKMDIEGAEHEVICSTPKDILRRIAFLDLDVHDLNNLEYFSGGPDPQVMLDYLAECGFETVDRSGDEKAYHLMLRRI